MSFTVNTNAGAMIALQNLGSTNKQLAEVQTRINTGLAVASAKDNGGTFAIAQKMRGDVAGYSAVQNSLDRAQSTVDVALAAGEAVSDLLVQMKEKALAAKDASLDTASRTALNEDFKALRDQVGKIVSNASFNGVNMISGTTSVVALANADGSNTITVGAENMSLSGAVVTLTTTATIDTVTNATSQVTAIGASLDNLGASLARLGTGAKALEIHSTFVTKLSDALTQGIGNLVDADLAKESARLQALQVKQQLGIQALAIANAAPGSVLGLFR